jgi:hypothetical protein
VTAQASAVRGGRAPPPPALGRMAGRSRAADARGGQVGRLALSPPARRMVGRSHVAARQEDGQASPTDTDVVEFL